MKYIFALAFGSMIGWGWVVLTGGWVETGGWLGACLAFLIGAILCVFVGLCFAELTPALPCAGGNMVFSYRALGYGGSWIAVWATAFAYLGVAAWEGIAIATAINYIVPILSIGYLWTIAGYDVYMSWCAVGMVIGLVIVLINFFGGKAAVLFQTVATLLLIIVGLIFFLGAMGLGDASYMGPAFINSKGFIGVILMTPAMFVGFDVIPQSAEEMNIPRKKTPTVLILSILLATLWYIAIILGVAKAAPPEIIAGAEVGVTDAAAFVFNTQIMGKVVIIGALCGILTSWNGFIIGAVRVLFAMGRAKMLPPVFGKLHSKYKTPYASFYSLGRHSLLVRPAFGGQRLSLVCQRQRIRNRTELFDGFHLLCGAKAKGAGLAPPLCRPSRKDHGTPCYYCIRSLYCFVLPAFSRTLSLAIRMGHAPILGSARCHLGYHHQIYLSGCFSRGTGTPHFWRRICTGSFSAQEIDSVSCRTQIIY